MILHGVDQLERNAMEVSWLCLVSVWDGTPDLGLGG